MFSKNDWQNAIPFAEKSLKIKTSLFQNNPTNDSHRNNLLAGYSNVGTIFYSGGQYEKALEYYQIARKMIDKILLSEPENHGIRFELSSSCINFGNVFSSKKELLRALRITKNLTEFLKNLPYMSQTEKILHPLKSKVSL